MNQEKLAKLQAQVRIGGKVGVLLWLLSLYYCSNSDKCCKPNVEHHPCCFRVYADVCTVVAHFKKCDGILLLPDLFLLTSAFSLWGRALGPIVQWPLWACSNLLWGRHSLTRWRYLSFVYIDRCFTRFSDKARDILKIKGSVGRFYTLSVNFLILGFHEMGFMVHFWSCGIKSASVGSKQCFYVNIIKLMGLIPGSCVQTSGINWANSLDRVFFFFSQMIFDCWPLCSLKYRKCHLIFIAWE